MSSSSTAHANAGSSRRKAPELAAFEDQGVACVLAMTDEDPVDLAVGHRPRLLDRERDGKPIALRCLSEVVGTSLSTLLGRSAASIRVNQHSRVQVARRCHAVLVILCP